ncbi:Zinc-responsive transcriptional regulator ZAP1 [Pseudozyma hubeiensis]|nr:Zinc-responsive transcriptional regulator ZAP1 [Pseudozyma hubeiensis]
MAASTEDVLSLSASPTHIQPGSRPTSSTVPLAKPPSRSSSSHRPIKTTSPCSTIVCCDVDHSDPPASCATECNDCSTLAPSSPCSDIHHISSACTEPSCGAATSSTNTAICPTAVACCDDTACADVPGSPCSQSTCSGPGDCSSMTLAVPIISTCCTDQSCEPEPASHVKAHSANASISKAQVHGDRSTHTPHNECRECRGSLTSTGTAGGGQLYSSFQELLDCCCCSIPPTVEQCCVGATPIPCNQPHASPADTASLPVQPHHDHHHSVQLAPVPPHPPPPSDTPSSSIITNATQHTSRGSRASTVSTTATPQPIAPSPSLPWSSGVLQPSTPHLKANFGGASSLDSHHNSPVAAHNVSFQDILTELQSWNDCMFEQPHLHSSHGGCLDPAMTLCNSDVCQTSAPHSHWMPAHSNVSHQHQVPNTMQQDVRPQMCQWAGCHERFWTVEELVAHVNHSHLARKNPASATAPSNMADSKDLLVTSQQEAGSVAHSRSQSGVDLQSAASGLECLWNDCHQVPMPEKLEFGTFTPTTEADLWKPNALGTVPGSGRDDKVSLAILQHLLHDHLGQHSSAPFSLHAAQHLAPPTPSSPHHAGEALLSSSKDSASSLSSWSSSKKRKSSDTSSGGAYCSETEKLICRWQGCSAQFNSHSALTDHIETAHVGSGKAEYECRWIGCPRHASGQKFSQKQKVLRHLQTHTGDRPFKCTQCGKRFSEQNTLAQHIRTHTLERPYVCDHPGCGKAFSVAGSLTIHKRIHTGSKPFVCTFPGCGKAFAESSNLTKHVRTHTGDRPFRCAECGKGFSRPDQLSRHRKTHERKREERGETMVLG